jgi:hypothetical protein
MVPPRASLLQILANHGLLVNLTAAERSDVARKAANARWERELVSESLFNALEPRGGIAAVSIFYS